MPRNYADITAFQSRDEALKALVMDRFNHSNQSRGSYFSRCRRWYDMYRGWWIDPNAPEHRNNVFIPLIFSTVWSDVARKAQAIFGEHPYVSFTGYGEEDAPIARQQELLISAQMRDADSYMKGIDTFLSGDLYGLAPIQTGWTFEQMKVPERSLVSAPYSQQLLERVRMTDATLFDGPDWEPIDILDFFPQPNVPRLHDMRWVIRRFYMELDDVRLAASVGLFRKGAVSELEFTGLQSDIESDLKLRMGSRRNNVSFGTEKYSKPVEILEMWGFLPRELERDGHCRYVVSLGNRQVVMRDRPNPFWHGLLPYNAYTPVVDPHNFEGPAKAELGEHLQNVANRLVDNRLDVLDLVVDPPHLYDKMLGVDPDNLYVRPGRWIGVDGPPAGSVHPLTPDLRGFQLSHQEVEYAWRWLQNASGIHEDAVMGAAGPDRETARGFAGRQAAVNTRLLLEVRIYEEQIVEPLANRFRALNRQFLPIPLKRQILGSNAITDSVTGLPIPQEVLVDDQALNRDYNARALGSSMVVPKESRQQSLIALLQAAAATPLVQMMNWQVFGRQLFRTFDIPNVDELMIPPVYQALAMQLAQQGGQQQPGAEGGQPGGQPNPMALPGMGGPETMGQPGGMPPGMMPNGSAG